jgi:hypothetical protein
MQRCRWSYRVAEEMQTRCRGAKVVLRSCRGSMCRFGAGVGVVVAERCRGVQRCRSRDRCAGADVQVQRCRFRGAGAVAEGQRCIGAGTEVHRLLC